MKTELHITRDNPDKGVYVVALHYEHDNYEQIEDMQSWGEGPGPCGPRSAWPTAFHWMRLLMRRVKLPASVKQAKLHWHDGRCFPIGYADGDVWPTGMKITWEWDDEG